MRAIVIPHYHAATLITVYFSHVSRHCITLRHADTLLLLLRHITLPRYAMPATKHGAISALAILEAWLLLLAVAIR